MEYSVPVCSLKASLSNHAQIILVLGYPVHLIKGMGWKWYERLKVFSDEVIGDLLSWFWVFDGFL